MGHVLTSGWRNGRRFRLKIEFPKGSVGSSPTPGTRFSERICAAGLVKRPTRAQTIQVSYPMANATPSAPDKFKPEVQHRWLIEHLPHRIRGILVGIPMRAPWILPPVPIAGMDSHQVISLWCLGNSNWEGRLTAMRWLIMFLGISGNASTQTKGVPARPELRPNGHDARIDMLDGGVLFPLQGNDAETLALVWKGCTKATSHPTEGSGHPDVTEKPLAAALHIVIAHLEGTIYAEKNRSLFEDTLGPNADGAPKKLNLVPV